MVYYRFTAQKEDFFISFFHFQEFPLHLHALSKVSTQRVCSQELSYPSTHFSSIPADECSLDESEAFRFFVDTTGAAAADEELADNLLSLINEPPASGTPPPPVSVELLASEYGYFCCWLVASFVVACCKTDGAKIEALGTFLLLPPDADDDDDLSELRLCSDPFD